jgi:hypothetical protein
MSKAVSELGAVEGAGHSPKRWRRRAGVFTRAWTIDQRGPLGGFGVRKRWMNYAFLEAKTMGH